MPKRVIDGDALWTSDKLLQVEPESFRAEFANLVPLSLANGSFECDPRKIWTRVYAYNRPSFTLDMVAAMLKELERVKMLFRWTEADGKVWGNFVGINKPGRLPSRSDIKKGEKIGAEVPQALLQEFLAAPQGRRPGGGRAETGREPGGDSAHGFGFGSGKGSGSGSADAGGAGGEAPASEAPETPGTKAPGLSSFSEDHSKGNDAPPSPAAQTAAVPESTPALRPTSNLASTLQASPVTPTSTPVPTPKNPPDAPEMSVASVPDRPEPFDALDFAMTRCEPFAGLDPKLVQRVVFYHWRATPKPYWSLLQAKVNSPARLEQTLPKMLEQMPPEFKVPGSATLVLPQSDPNCTVCGGQGFIPGRNEAYTGELEYLQANPCSCVTYDTKPWRTRTREVLTTAVN
jgi:hypothetical protein